MTGIAQQQSELNKKIDEFLDFLEFDSHFSPLTIRNYRHYLKRFSEFAGNKEISKPLIDNYKTYLKKIGLSSKTVGFHLIAIRSFIKWERKKGEVVMNVEEIEVPKTKGSKIEFLTGSDVEKLSNAPDLGTIQGKRDRAIMELFYSTGLRVSELASLNRENVDFMKKELIIGNGDEKRRAIFLSHRALGWIENYLKSRKDKFEPLFIHHKGQSDGKNSLRLSIRSIQRMIKKYRKKVGLNKTVTPKTLRASFAIDILMAGAEVGSVQEMLGHKNISTTQIYTHVTNRQLREVHAAFHGRGGS